MNRQLVSEYVREVEMIVRRELELNDPDAAIIAIKEALLEHPGDEDLVNMLGNLLRSVAQVESAQREFYLKHLLIITKLLFSEMENTHAIALLEKAYASGFYNREVIDLMCALYSRLGENEKIHEMLELHVDGSSVDADDSDTDHDHDLSALSLSDEQDEPTSDDDTLR